MKRISLTLCLSLTSAGLVLADHHGGSDELGKKLDELLAGISQPDEAKRYEPRMAVRDLTSAATVPGAATRDVYVKLLLDRLAGDETSQAARAWIVRQLENVGAAESVPALKKLMGSPFHQLRELARRALEQNPSDEAGEALRSLAEAEQDRQLKRALVHTLGQRGDAQAVGLVSGLLESKDQAMRRTAIEALGKIASDEAVAALKAAYDSGENRSLAADALFTAARRMRGDRADGAEGVYVALYRYDQPPGVQAAALRGLIEVRPDQADDLILLALQSKEASVRQAAINGCRGLKSPSVMPNVLAVKLPDLSAEEQAMALAVLGESGDLTVAAQLGDTLADGGYSDELRLTVIAVLGQLGGVDAAGKMLDLAGRTEDEELKKAAQAALAVMPGGAIDASLLAATKTGDIQLRAEAIGALGSRGSSEAVPVLFDHVEKGPKAIRQASLNALGELATSGDLPRLVSYLNGDGNQAIRAIMSVCRRATAPDIAVRAILAAMDSQSASVNEKLLPCLGILGGEAALKKVESLLEDEALGKTAMKTLTGWSGSEAGPSFIKLASAEGIGDVDRTLILRGLVRLLENRDNALKSEDRLKFALRGIDLAKRVEDKRIFLPVLGRLGTPEAIQTLVTLLEDEDLAEEAALAALTAVERVRGRRRAGRLKQRVLKAVIRAEVEADTVEKAQKMLDEL